MEPKKFSLCPLCEACPEVVITDEGVTIGEDATTVRLSHAEWNELVLLIKRGEVWRNLTKIGRGSFGGRVTFWLLVGVCRLAQNRLPAAGVIGFVVSMLGCVTPVLVALLAVLGVSDSMGWSIMFCYRQWPSLPRWQAMRWYAGDATMRCRRRMDDLLAARLKFWCHCLIERASAELDYAG